ncbi:hypothetical protein W822_08865 [Advenella kashmirensis W13003]|uniref:Decarboxylase n=1 Tax=Advenella kashmirensis W13003 TaxID=1424334 RepID=V8QTG4_9BURK|nr:acetolactate synthase large subunit [Advenella kashmirensis]ETF02932.1 hypothetical protein W822_08865 [Advenella kashmirensis W13003]
MNGADALCDTLLEGGIDTCFANPGTSEMHFVAALDRKPQMRCVLALFEGVATGAADGYARMLERPAATLLHLGPGLANGLANLHNARRARTPLVNIVGDHSSQHLQYDAPLTCDVASLAAPMSHWVRRINDADDVPVAAAESVERSLADGGAVATLIFPADAAWNACSAPPVIPNAPPALPQVSQRRIALATNALRTHGDRVVLLLGAQALKPEARVLAARICDATGARMLAQQSNARLERGAGRVPVLRIPYPVEQARAMLDRASHILLLDATAPVGFFSYPGKPGSGVPEHCAVHAISSSGEDAYQALQAMADDLGIDPNRPVIYQALARPGLPTGALSADAIVQTVATLMPEQAIICDEAISSGRRLLEMTAGAPPHDMLFLNGGAIGIGLPLATGAAIACPDRAVICLQADGSAMYTLQALWTQARENLHVITIIFSNRSYALLHQELAKVGAGRAGQNASRLLDIVEPSLDWCKLAQGMGVEAVAVDTVRALADCIQVALSRSTPFLIEARI